MVLVHREAFYQYECSEDAFPILSQYLKDHGVTFDTELMGKRNDREADLIIQGEARPGRGYFSPEEIEKIKSDAKEKPVVAAAG